MKKQYFCIIRTKGIPPMVMTLKELEVGNSAQIVEIAGEKSLRQHFLDMGMIPGAEVTLVKYAPLGDPMQVLVHGYELTLRLADAEKITVKPSTSRQLATPSRKERKERKKATHPGLGESSPVFHDYSHQGTPKKQQVSFALVGNQNCGKTTLFNQLTGMNRHVGNFPGVTVDTKSGSVKGYPQANVTDLPGIYSLSPYTQEEIVTRTFILDSHPDAIINIVDATNIERNLYLTIQLMELNIPMVLALNMMDELHNNGGTVNINLMEQMLGIPVVPISAIRNEGVDELMEHAIHVAQYEELPARQDFCHPSDHGGAVHRSLHGVMHLIEDHAQKAHIPIRFAGSKLVEGDELVEKALQLKEREKQTVELILSQMEEERGLDPAAAIADMRFSFIEKVCQDCVVKPLATKEHLRSLYIDRLLTGKQTAMPVFLLIMALIFWLTFDLIGGNLQQLLERGIDDITQVADRLLTQWNIHHLVHAMVIDGIFNGVGTVLSFLPVIITLFFFLSLLEDSGYMARIAFVMDKVLRKIGLSGRSIVPLLIGFGCSVPSIMASRTLPSVRDRKLTILLTPFMSCTAKLPIYAFFTAAFFPDKGAWVMLMLYLTGILTGIVVALFLHRGKLKGKPVPFVMELPNYRIPSLQSVGLLMWEKGKDFLQKAFTVIFVASMVIWMLQTFNWQLQPVTDSHDSMLAMIAGWLVPLFQPIGLGDWRVVVSLISGFLAKESVVSSLTVLIGTGMQMTEVLSTAGVVAMLVFCLLYTPCIAAVATVRREMGTYFTLRMVIWQCLVAWLCAWAAHTAFLFLF